MRISPRCLTLAIAAPATGHTQEIIAKLNPVLPGGGNYFRTGTADREFVKVGRYAYLRRVLWLYRRGG